jgi:hypothetical protein
LVADWIEVLKGVFGEIDGRGLLGSGQRDFLVYYEVVHLEKAVEVFSFDI